MRAIKFRVWHNGQMFYDCQLNAQGKIMQFTGLLDKNSKEIWEGDLVDEYGDRKLVYRIGFDRGHFTLTDIKNGYDRLGIWNVYMRMEVIGNIYEQPELLK